MRVGYWFIYFGNGEFGGEPFVVVIPDLDAVVHVEAREMEDLVGGGGGGKEKISAGGFPHCLKDREPLLAARLDHSFDLDDLKTARVGPDAAYKETLPHALRVGLLNWG